ncbi:uncharacterized protein LY89DRAFT_736283 [Mollisia scopiformis]|uniref:CCHC-type domain-containing protein n=1 Tax=Mollisia scopiformis TaxID=149040 RepID=A0A194X212_MOLSC|nr:uncharacterized protein LY89DRAFT_736283 [Mollisia scopiformis]KUJ14235.1 hypothetical protein LY89DRAFT_736283 [Mollisia scopiformis]
MYRRELQQRATSRLEDFYEIECKGNKYWLRCKKQTIAMIDKPKPTDMSTMVAHPSEQGWNLPVGHVRHFLKFPIDIRLSIFDRVLTLSKAETIAPRAVTSNWKRFIDQPRFVVHNKEGETYEQGTPVVIETHQTDEDGEYTQLNYVYFKAIDASCLRVCKQFYQEGSSLLYGNNSYAFGMVNKHYHTSPPSYFHGSGEHRPDPRKPLATHLTGAIARSMPKIHKRSHVKSLPGWIYYDSFLRFLWTITPRNTAMLRSLIFTGNVKIHHCDRSLCPAGGCEDSIIKSLRLYIPFFNTFCPNLKYLAIQAKEDVVQPGPPYPLRPGEPANRDEALQRFLDELRNIVSLQKLVVIDESQQPLQIAKSTMEWFNHRTNERARAEAADRQKLIPSTKEKVKTLETTCKFCGGEHVWPDCWDLCNFCGVYGHYRSTCPELQK